MKREQARIVNDIFRALLLLVVVALWFFLGHNRMPQVVWGLTLYAVGGYAIFLALRSITRTLEKLRRESQ